MNIQKAYTDIEFDIKGIYWSTVLVAIMVVPFLVLSKKYAQQGFVMILLVVLVLFNVYLLTVFVRTYWAAISFKKDYFIDNHRVLALPRKIWKKDITSIDIIDVLNRGGKVRYIQISLDNNPKPILIFDDRLTVSTQELFDMITAWKKD